jgi:hypothetical protein
MVTHRRKPVVPRCFIVPALVFCGCGSSSSSDNLDAQAGGRETGARGAEDSAALLADGSTETGVAPPDVAAKRLDGGLADVQVVSKLDGGLADVQAVSKLDGGLDGTPATVARPDGGLDLALDAAAVLDAIDSQPQVTLRQGGAWVNCMPMVNADPIDVTWTVDVAGARGSTAQLVESTVTASNGTSSIVQDFTVASPTIALVNGTGSADQRKPINGSSANTACDSMCSGGATYRLDLVFTIDGQSVSVSKSGNLSCAY